MADKADRCDIRKGLRESVRGTWTGDEDLGDGSLQILFNEHKTRFSFVRRIGTSARLKWIFKDVDKMINDLQNDLEFLASGSKSANSAVEEGARRLRRPCMMELAWNAARYDELVKKV